MCWVLYLPLSNDSTFLLVSPTFNLSAIHTPFYSPHCKSTVEGMKAVVERGGRKLLSEIRGRVQMMLGRWCLWVDMSTALTPFIVYLHYFIRLQPSAESVTSNSPIYCSTYIVISLFPQRHQHPNTVLYHLLTFRFSSIIYISLGLQQ